MNKLQGMLVTEEDEFHRNILLGTIAVDIFLSTTAVDEYAEHQVSLQ